MTIKTSFSPASGERAAQIFVLSNAALALPLMELLANDPYFFINYQCSFIQSLIVLFFFCFAPAVALIALDRALALFSGRLSLSLHLAAVFVFAMLFFLPVAKAITVLPWMGMFALAAVAGAMYAIGYWRTRFLRTFALWLSVPLLVAPFIFLFLSPLAEQLHRNPKSSTSSPLALTSTPPIVFLIVDELPMATLLTSDGTINATLFPNFAALGASSHWFLNTFTVADDTNFAVPAILSAASPKINTAPLAQNYPKTLFSWFSGAYRIVSFEPWIKLCPADVCEVLRGRKSAISHVAGVIYYRLRPALEKRILPADFCKFMEESRSERNKSLSALNKEATRKQGFEEKSVASVSAGKKEPTLRQRIVAALMKLRPSDPTSEAFDAHTDNFHLFLDHIKPAPTPALYFAHFALPHSPFRYMASGKSHSHASVGADLTIGLVGDEFLARELLHGHMLQTAFLDRLLGKMVTHLKEQGLWDEAIVLLIADHGISMVVGEDARTVQARNAGGILPVPFFIKAPGQKIGVRHEELALNIDAVPTMLGLLDYSGAIEGDGASALRPSREDMKLVHGVIAKKQQYFDVPVDETIKLRAAVVEQQERLISSFNGEPAVAQGSTDLIGKSLSADPLETARNVVASIDGVAKYHAVDLTKDHLPARISGELRFTGRTNEAPLLGIALNGRFAAVIKTMRLDDNKFFFSVVLPESSLRQGQNVFRLVLVDRTTDEGVTERRAALREIPLAGSGSPAEAAVRVAN